MCSDKSVVTRSRSVGKWNDPLIAFGLFAIGVLLYLVGLYQMWTDVGGVADVPAGVRIGMLALLCAIDSFRRVRPATALAAGAVIVAVDAALGPTLPMWLVLSDLTYAAVLYGTARLGRVVCSLTAVTVAALTALVYLSTQDVRAAAGAGVVTALFFGTPVWWALVIRRQVELTEAERERSRVHEALAALDREAAVAHERATMARDLHDVIASHLSAIAIHSEAALSTSALSGERGEPDDGLREMIGAIRSSSLAGLSEMRSMIELLHAGDDETPDPRSSPPRLTELPVVLDAVRAAGAAVHVAIDVDAADLPSVVDHTAYRITQEALTNALKHAPGAPISMSISLQHNALQIEIRNPVGRDTSSFRAGTHGLANMRHRAELLGGSLDALPVDGEWTVCAQLPVPAPNGTDR
jgi:signal transduction histidine kinase